ncbi:ogr/Delta-like zinc finger family protein [candidate division CSSED10-310 bacterium]|uniref:Ogr/Delta-like zinc finger family protein n=1 Tax=candidate division CSSED10-310 bacterium TaxID=2855610 RepID=A0ABV6YUP3_UNCC1
MNNGQDYTCPHCQQQMNKWRVPIHSTWNAEFFFVCFNDDCPYFRKGWDVIERSVKAHASYRYYIDPINNNAGPLPVWSDTALKDDVIDE